MKQFFMAFWRKKPLSCPSEPRHSCQADPSPRRYRGSGIEAGGSDAKLTDYRSERLVDQYRTWRHNGWSADFLDFWLCGLFGPAAIGV